MPIDPTGTQPGVQPQVKEPKKHFMKCKNKDCAGVEVYEMNIPGLAGAGTHVYRCVKCNLTWGVATGGAVNL